MGHVCPILCRWGSAKEREAWDRAHLGTVHIRILALEMYGLRFSSAVPTTYLCKIRYRCSRNGGVQILFILW